MKTTTIKYKNLCILLLLTVGFAGCGEKVTDEEQITDEDGFIYTSSNECYTGYYMNGHVWVDNHQCEMSKPCFFHNQSFEFFFYFEWFPEFKDIYPNLNNGDSISFQIVKYKKPEIVLAIWGNLYSVDVKPCK